MKKKIYAISSGDDSDTEPMSTEMLEYIFEGSQYHTSVNRREERYKIFDCIKLSQAEWKGE